jgi:hypothetical protein
VAKFKLGKNALLTPPSGLSVDDVMDVNINVSGDELDATVFGDSESLVTPGLADVTFEITATNHTTAQGATGTITVAGFTAMPVMLEKIDGKVSPKGKWEYTLTYSPTLG